MFGLDSPIKIKALQKFRCFEEGQEKTLSFADGSSVFLYMVGRNGSGKSTLLDAIRCMKNSSNKSALALSKSEFNGVFEITGLEQFNKVFHLSATIDDALSMWNSCDAVSFIDNGGYGQTHISHGQRSAAQLGRFLEEVEKNITPEDAGKILLVLDEIDKGFDLRYQIGFTTLIKNICLRYGAVAIIVSHNPICWMTAEKVYSLEDDKIMDSSEYIKKSANVDIKIDIPEGWSVFK